MAALWLPDCSGLHGGQVFYFCYLAGKNTSYAVISYACRVMGYMQLVKTFYLYFFSRRRTVSQVANIYPYSAFLVVPAVSIFHRLGCRILILSII